MKKLTDEEINIIWTSELSFRELVQAAYERGYQEAITYTFVDEDGLRRLVKDMDALDTNEERDAMWYEYQKNRNR